MFEAIVNARDLGGVRIGDKVVRKGLLLRTGHLHDATEEDVERIISNFKVDSSKIVHNEYDLYEDIYPEEGGYDFDEGWDW